MHSEQGQQSAGMTLIELAIALVVLLLGTSTLFVSITSSMEQDEVSHWSAAAKNALQSHMERVLADSSLAPGSSGPEDVMRATPAGVETKIGETTVTVATEGTCYRVTGQFVWTTAKAAGWQNITVVTLAPQ
jgi:type II secretory pathway pseudopilin PulG